MAHSTDDGEAVTRAGQVQIRKKNIKRLCVDEMNCFSDICGLPTLTSNWLTSSTQPLRIHAPRLFAIPIYQQNRSEVRCFIGICFQVIHPTKQTKCIRILIQDIRR